MRLLCADTAPQQSTFSIDIENSPRGAELASSYSSYRAGQVQCDRAYLLVGTLDCTTWITAFVVLISQILVLLKIIPIQAKCFRDGRVIEYDNKTRRCWGKYSCRLRVRCYSTKVRQWGFEQRSWSPPLDWDICDRSETIRETGTVLSHIRVPLSLPFLFFSVFFFHPAYF